jgi:hypothetical protein
MTTLKRGATRLSARPPENGCPPGLACTPPSPRSNKRGCCSILLNVDIIRYHRSPLYALHDTPDYCYERCATSHPLMCSFAGSSGSVTTATVQRDTQTSFPASS